MVGGVPSCEPAWHRVGQGVCMPVFRVHRHAPLSPREISKLPNGAVGVRGSGDVVARMEAQGSLERLLSLAFHLGSAVPDGRLSVDDARVDASADPTPEERAAEAAAAQEAREAAELAGPEKDALTLLREGDLEGATSALADKGLSSDEQGQVRRLMLSTDPSEVVVACQAARLASHKTYAMNIRRHLTHSDARVRLAAVEALGVLAGPSLVPALRPLVHDTNPDIKAAAEAAIQAIESR